MDGLSRDAIAGTTTVVSHLLSGALIGLGGAAGTLLRYGIGEAAKSRFPDAWFPLGTFAANALGSLALGFVFVFLSGREVFGVDARLVFGTGMMGGFTTYSTFNLETLKLIEGGATGRAAMYVLATVVTCLVFGAGGLALGRALSAS